MNTRIPTDSASRQRIADILAQAERFRRSGRKADAERCARDAVGTDPNAAAALNFLALLVRDRGDLAEAHALLLRAVAAAPDEALYRANLGTLLRRMNDLVGAEASYAGALALRPRDAETNYNLGIVLAELGKSDQALAALRRACAQKPGFAEALTQIGALLKKREDYAEALAILDQAIALDPKLFDAHYFRGTTLTGLKRYDEAIVALRQALALKPGKAEAHHALGTVLERAAQEEPALEAFGRAIELAPDLVDAHRRFNALAWQMGRKDIYLTSFALARSRIGEKPDLLLAEADQLLRQGQYEHAEQLLQRAHGAAPERNDIAHVLSRALIMQRKFSESIALLDVLLKADPQVLANHRALANALLQDGRAAEAVAVIERGLAVNPYDQLLLAFLTLAYRELGDSRLDALADFEKLVVAYELPPPSGFADIDTFNRALGEDLLALHTRNVEPIDQTLRGGTQTPGYLFDRSTRAIDGVRERIREAVADYVQRLPDDPSHPLAARKDSAFDFAGAWSCRLRSSGFHTNHVHPQGWISSAYYVSLPDAVSDAQGRQGWIKFGESNIALGERDRPERVVKPAVGKLVLFPSYLWHGTVPFTSDDMRLTVAFDVVPGRAKSDAKSSGY